MARRIELERLQGRPKRPRSERPDRARGATDAAAIEFLQQSAGNAAVARMMSESTAPAGVTTHSEQQTMRLETAIPIGPRSPLAPAVRAATADRDSHPGHEHGDELPAVEPKIREPQLEGPVAAEAPPAAEGKEAAGKESEPIRLPDIEVRDFEDVELCDSVVPILSYSGKIERGGAAPSGFGVTRAGPMKVKDITVREVPLIGWWYVSATIEQTIKWQVRTGTGPNGEVNISSSTDSAITAANWPTVQSDLTPDMSDLNGRPPRTQFWAEDLTERHEHFHANDRKTRGPGAVSTAAAWLRTQQASSVADVNTLLEAVPGRVVAAVSAGMTMPGKEERAYGDGAPAYSRRAMAISVLGNLGYYS